MTILSRRAVVAGMGAALAMPTIAKPATARLLHAEEFNSLDLASVSNPNGFWRPNDWWQDLSLGYLDFSYSKLPSWDINPNDPKFVGYSPFSVANSVLTIKIERTPGPLVAPIQAQIAAQKTTTPYPNYVPPYVSGILISNPNAFTFRYGYIEWHMALPVSGRGMWPALWLYAAKGTPYDKRHAEIDMLEVFGAPNHWYTTLHGLVSNDVLGEASQDTTGWHTYGLDWQPDHIAFYRDGVLTHIVTGPEATYFDMPMNIRMSYAMNGNWSGFVQADATTPNPMIMQIDYVRLYDQRL